MKKRIAVKFKDRIAVLLSEQASSSYSNIGKHLVFTMYNISSSEAEFATFPNEEFAER